MVSGVVVALSRCGTSLPPSPPPGSGINAGLVSGGGWRGGGKKQSEERKRRS